MPQLQCTVRRIGDHESRTEEYEVAYTAGQKTLAKFSWRAIQSAKYEQGEARSSTLDY